MSYLDVFTANALPKDSQGRAVLVISRKRGKAFIVPPDRAPHLLRLLRAWFGIMMLAILVSAFVFGPTVMLGVALVLLASYLLKLRHFTSGLEVATEIPVIIGAVAVQNAMTAMGSRTLVVVAALGAIQAAIGVWLLATGSRSIWVWLFALYGAVVAILYTVRWLQFRQMRRQADP